MSQDQTTAPDQTGRRQSRMPGNRASQMPGRNRRQTMWPSPFGQEEEPGLPSWPGQQQRNTKRWTSTFDSEARATRMSFYVGDTLLPQAPPAPDQWAGSAAARNRQSMMHAPQNNRRQTWMKSIMKEEGAEDVVPIWQGNFEVEKRASFASRASDDSQGSWFRDSMDADADAKYDLPRPRDPLTPEQMAKADPAGGLVPVEILSYPFPGEGTPEDPYLVSWVENDPANPLNFTKGRKWTNALILALAVWTVSIASSGFSQGECHLYLKHTYLPNPALPPIYLWKKKNDSRLTQRTQETLILNPSLVSTAPLLSSSLLPLSSASPPARWCCRP